MSSRAVLDKCFGVSIEGPVPHQEIIDKMASMARLGHDTDPTKLGHIGSDGVYYSGSGLSQRRFGVERNENGELILVERTVGPEGHWGNVKPVE